MQYAYRQFISARTIQNAWRGSEARAIRRILTQQMFEHYAILMMQSLFRRKLARMHFVALREYLLPEKIAAAVTVQRVYRGYTIRSAGYRFVRWIAVRKKEARNATIIQSR